VDNRLAYADQLVAQFVEEFTATATLHSGSDHLAPVVWIKILPSLLPDSGRTLKTAILALSSAGIARERRDELLLQNATMVYVKAMGYLQADLYDGRRLALDETLVACLTLILYQAIGEYSGKQDWMSHVKGFAQLVRLRGPGSFSSGTASVIFRSARINFLYAALCSVEPSFLAGEAWIKLPWTLIPKNHHDEMVDLLAVLPRIVHESGQIGNIADPIERRDQRMNLVMECWKMRASFARWYSRLSDNLTSLAVVEGSWNIPGAAEGVAATFSQSYEFNGLGAAHMHMVYWASLLIVNNMIKLLYQALEAVETSYFWPHHPSALRCATCFPAFDPLSAQSVNGCQCGGWVKTETRFDTSGLPRLTEAIDAVPLATKICMSIRYCFHQEIKILGPYFTLFPLKMAIGCFTANQPETTPQLRWCYAVIELLESRGIEFSRKMLGMYEGRALGGFGS
jgi:hypothetical protein